MANSDDLRPQVMGVMITFWILSWTIVSLRIYVRTVMIKSFGKDDIAMIITLLLFTAYLSCQAAAVTHGIGRHRKDIPQDALPIGFAAWMFAEIFYTLSASVLKVAVGLFLERITQNKVHIVMLRIMMAATLLVGTVYFFVALFQCTPISFYWDFSPNAKGHCISPMVLVVISYVASVLNGAADFFFGILPIFIVKDLNMRKNTKIVVAAILGFAAIGSLSTLVRLPYVKQLGTYKGEFLYTSTYIALWSTVEVGIGISAASLATLRPLVQKFFPTLLPDSPSAPTNSNLKWSTKQGRRARRKGDPLDSAEAGTRNKGTMITTVTGARPTSGSHDNGSQENIFAGGAEDRDMMPLKTWDHGISKSVQVTTTEERHASRSSASIESSKGYASDDTTNVYERV
ncbi:integral membrane protein [Aureobasidium sp. EXF-10727]|nr:integral membrane protein [Aureobasidium sp. EXF-10727]KAI4725267.1 integral membrane protein [Aureobasidium sp. EXF-10728]